MAQLRPTSSTYRLYFVLLLMKSFNWVFNNLVYCVAELVVAEKKRTDWFPERSEFSYTDR